MNVNDQIPDGSRKGFTPLHYAIMKSNCDLVKVLLENGADPYLEDANGQNAFDLANCQAQLPKPEYRKRPTNNEIASPKQDKKKSKQDKKKDKQDKKKNK